ncbi:MAG: dTMP kinase [Desulfovibrionaceae bacterium]
MFITLEGGEGAGKSTIVRSIQEYCDACSIHSYITKEPGGSALGKQIRPILLNQDSKNITPLSELFLYLADRAYHVENCIRPAIEQGCLVISDRYVDSTLVYQGYARNIVKEDIIYLNSLSTGGLLPDYTFVLDVDPEIGLARTHKRSLSDTVSARESRFEMESMEFHQTIRTAYLEIAKGDSRFIIVDANRTKEEVCADVIAQFKKILL